MDSFRNYSEAKVTYVYSSAGCYLYVSHTGFGGVAYAMAIICVRLGAGENFASKIPQSLSSPNRLYTPEEDLPSRVSDEEALRMGDYRDILSLTRVLVFGPKSKADVDLVIERYLSETYEEHTSFYVMTYLSV